MVKSSKTVGMALSEKETQEKLQSLRVLLKQAVDGK